MLAKAELPRLKKKQGMGPRERLLASAGQVFAEKGVENVTIREIATAANVQLSDLYRHFSDKHDLYAEVCRLLFHDMATRYDHLWSAKISPQRRLLEFTASLYRELAEDSQVLPILVTALLKPETSGIALLADDFFRRQFNHVVECVKEISLAPKAERAAYSIYILVLGHVQMAPFGKAVPIQGIRWNSAVSMARYILGSLIPSVEWTKVKAVRSEAKNQDVQ